MLGVAPGAARLDPCCGLRRWAWRPAVWRPARLSRATWRVAWPGHSSARGVYEVWPALLGRVAGPATQERVRPGCSAQRPASFGSCRSACRAAGVAWPVRLARVAGFAVRPPVSRGRAAGPYRWGPSAGLSVSTVRLGHAGWACRGRGRSAARPARGPRPFRSWTARLRGSSGVLGLASGGGSARVVRLAGARFGLPLELGTASWPGSYGRLGRAVRSARCRGRRRTPTFVRPGTLRRRPARRCSARPGPAWACMAGAFRGRAGPGSVSGVPPGPASSGRERAAAPARHLQTSARSPTPDTHTQSPASRVRTRGPGLPHRKGSLS